MLLTHAASIKGDVNDYKLVFPNPSPPSGDCGGEVVAKARIAATTKRI